MVPDPGGAAYVRAWSITAQQFEDVFAQENRRPVGEPFDWTPVLAGDTTIGNSWYARVLRLDVPFASESQPALTFTWNTRLQLNPPVAAYRDTIARGLAEHLAHDEVVRYLDAAVGG